MKKTIRVVWVLVANSAVVWLTITRLSGTFSSRQSQNLEVWAEYVLEILLPVVGIVLELGGLKLAKLVNIGCLTLAGCLWLGEAVWWHSDPFFGVLLIMSLGIFILAGITEVVYRRTKT
jgi:uncharacterized membrane protein YqaE (UPF0057 family)